jgi:hypothetical protein
MARAKKSDVGAFVNAVTELAAVTPKTLAIIARVADEQEARAAQEAFGAMFSEGKLPPVLIFSGNGEVGLADKSGAGDRVGVFFGITDLSKLLAMDADEVKNQLCTLIAGAEA